MKDLVEAPTGNDLAAVLTSSRSEIKDVIGRPHHIGIMLDHQNCVSQVAQVVKDLDQPVRIATMQSNRWLVQHIKRPYQP